VHLEVENWKCQRKNKKVKKFWELEKVSTCVYDKLTNLNMYYRMQQFGNDNKIGKSNGNGNGNGNVNLEELQELQESLIAVGRDLREVTSREELVQVVATVSDSVQFVINTELNLINVIRILLEEREREREKKGRPRKNAKPTVVKEPIRVTNQPVWKKEPFDDVSSTNSDSESEVEVEAVQKAGPTEPDRPAKLPQYAKDMIYYDDTEWQEPEPEEEPEEEPEQAYTVCEPEEPAEQNSGPPAKKYQISGINLFYPKTRSDFFKKGLILRHVDINEVGADLDDDTYDTYAFDITFSNGTYEIKRYPGYETIDLETLRSQVNIDELVWDIDADDFDYCGEVFDYAQDAITCGMRYMKVALKNTQDLDDHPEDKEDLEQLLKETHKILKSLGEPEPVQVPVPLPEPPKPVAVAVPEPKKRKTPVNKPAEKGEGEGDDASEEPKAKKPRKKPEPKSETDTEKKPRKKPESAAEKKPRKKAESAAEKKAKPTKKKFEVEEVEEEVVKVVRINAQGQQVVKKPGMTTYLKSSDNIVYSEDSEPVGRWCVTTKQIVFNKAEVESEVESEEEEEDSEVESEEYE
jgi:hypothetical protein